MYQNLSNQRQFILNKIIEIKDSFIVEICEREAMSKGLSKYFTAFDYFDKTLIILSATSGGVSIASFAGVIGAPVGIASASFSFAFPVITGFIRKLLKTTQNETKVY